jgi:asparagine synthase (glutamine-hydrolysing)
MCSIFSILNNDNLFSKEFIKSQFEKGKVVGPGNSQLSHNIQSTFGFHRIPNNSSKLPIIINDDIFLICNGEIYNYKELYQLMNVTPTTQSDCEVIIHLYKLYGIEETLNMLDGVYAFVLFDYRISNKDLTCKCYVGRDPFGIHSLFIMKSTDPKKNLIAFASEDTVLNEFQPMFVNDYTLQQFQPGTYSYYSLSNKVLSKWIPEKENIVYFIPSFPKTLINNSVTNEFMYNIMDSIRDSLKNAVYKRCRITEKPIAVLLSGSLESSLIAALVSQYYIETFGHNKLETYSIFTHDLIHAKIVADYIGSSHTEIVFTEKEISDTILSDTTTVRENYLVGKYIAQHSSAKVIFNGNGSDEVCGGKCQDPIEFDKETRRLLKDIHLFHDRCISYHGLELCMPFLDIEFVNNYISIPAFVRSNEYFKDKGIYIIEKFLLRASFSSLGGRILEKQILPDEILWKSSEK